MNIRQDPVRFFSRRGRPKYRVKQAAPGSYRTWCFARRSIRLASEQPLARWDVPGSRLFNPIRARMRAETKIVGCLEFDPKRLPSRRGAPYFALNCCLTYSTKRVTTSSAPFLQAIPYRILCTGPDKGTKRTPGAGKRLMCSAKMEIPKPAATY